MLRNLVAEYTPMAIVAIAFVFTVIKFYYIKHKGLHNHYIQIFFASLTILPKQEIKNTFHSPLKQYYKSSNKINSFFYLGLSFIGITYLFIKYVI